MDKELRREKKLLFWNSTAKAGLIAGGALAFGVILSYMANSSTSVGTAASIVICYVMGKLYTQKIERIGGRITYWNGFKFIVTAIAFAGVIHGATLFVMYSKIDPSYYREQYSTAMSIMDMPSDLKSAMEESYELYLTNPILAIVSGITTNVLIGLIPSFILAYIIKSKK